jgi:hypothetical protein
MVGVGHVSETGFHFDPQRLFFRAFCTEEEIDRILNPKSASDYLLRTRAETIADHARLTRVYRDKARKAGESWNLSSSFDDEHYLSVLERLPVQKKAVCGNVTYGDIFSNDPNGMIFKTDFGPILTISESLRHFLKFANLTLMDFGDQVPWNVKINAIRIAIRVMLKTEAMDFELDPRGIIPGHIEVALNAVTRRQMVFVAAHEFSHYLLGHLSDSQLHEQPIIRAISSRDDDYRPLKVYTTSHSNEFEADASAITVPRYGRFERLHITQSALVWFAALHLYQSVSNAFFPTPNWLPKSHPTALERFDEILRLGLQRRYLSSRVWKGFRRFVTDMEVFVLEDASVNFDDYEQYGSFYLDAPNTAWRGCKLIDRVDF